MQVRLFFSSVSRDLRWYHGALRFPSFCRRAWRWRKRLAFLYLEPVLKDSLFVVVVFSNSSHCIFLDRFGNEVQFLAERYLVPDFPKFLKWTPAHRMPKESWNWDWKGNPIA